MSIRVSSTSLIPGAIVVGTPGLGVLAESIPSSGGNGPGYAYSSLTFPADTGKEIMGRILSWPLDGTLTTFEDTSFEYEGHTFSTTYQLYVDGAPVGSPQTLSVVVSSGAVELTPGKASVSARGYQAAVTVSGAVTLQPSSGEATVRGYLASLSQGQVITPSPAATCRMYVKLNGTYVAQVMG